MNKDELKRVQQFIDSENFTAEIDDTNETQLCDLQAKIAEEKSYSDDVRQYAIKDALRFCTSSVQILINAKSNNFVLQTSTTCDAGAICMFISLNDESGAYDALEMSLKSFGFDDDFIEDNICEIGSMIKDQTDAQKIFDAYFAEYGSFEHAGGMDSNSEVFVCDGITCNN